MCMYMFACLLWLGCSVIFVSQISTAYRSTGSWDAQWSENARTTDCQASPLTSAAGTEGARVCVCVHWNCTIKRGANYSVQIDVSYLDILIMGKWHCMDTFMFVHHTQIHHTQIHVYTHGETHAHTYTHIHMHTHTHAHTHMHTYPHPYALLVL